MSWRQIVLLYRDNNSDKMQSSGCEAFPTGVALCVLLLHKINRDKLLRMQSSVLTQCLGAGQSQGALSRATAGDSGLSKVSGS